MEIPWAMIIQEVNDARLTECAVLCAFRRKFNELIGTDMFNVKGLHWMFSVWIECGDIRCGSLAFHRLHSYPLKWPFFDRKSHKTLTRISSRLEFLVRLNYMLLMLTISIRPTTSVVVFLRRTHCEHTLWNSHFTAKPCGWHKQQHKHHTSRVVHFKRENLKVYFLVLYDLYVGKCKDRRDQRELSKKKKS